MVGAGEPFADEESADVAVRVGVVDVGEITPEPVPRRLGVVGSQPYRPAVDQLGKPRGSLVGHAVRRPAVASPFRGVDAHDPDPQSALRVGAADGVEGVTVDDPGHDHNRLVGDGLTAAEQDQHDDHGRHRDHRGNDQGHQSEGRRGTHRFTTNHAQLTSTDQRQSRPGSSSIYRPNSFDRLTRAKPLANPGGSALILSPLLGRFPCTIVASGECWLLTGHAQALEDSIQVQGEGALSMTRSPEDAYLAHLQAVNTGDLEAILKNYADDVVVLTAQGPLEGKTGVEAFFKQAFSLLPQARVSAKQVVSSGAGLLVWWGAESPAGTVDDGVDTFVFDSGLIKLQSISFSPQLNQ
jgi:hypothetical protein